MACGMAGIPGNQQRIGLPKQAGAFPVVGNGLGGLPVRKSGAVLIMSAPITLSSDSVTGLRRGSIASMTPAQFILSYKIGGGSAATKVCLLDVVGSSVSSGSPYTYTARLGDEQPSIVSYDSTRALLSVPAESSTYGFRITNSGGTLSPSEVGGVAGLQYWSNFVRLGSDTFLRSRWDVTNADLRVGVDQFDGTTLSRWSPISIAISGNPGSKHALIGLSGGRCVLVHQNPSQAGRGEASVVTASGASTTFNSTTVISGASTTLIDAVGLDDSRILVTYLEGGVQLATVLTVTGTSVAVGVPKQFGPTSYYGSLHVFGDGMCVALWRDTLLDASLRYSFLTVSGNSVSASKDAVLSADQMYGSSVVPITATQALFVYGVTSPSAAVKAAVISIA